jgi:transcriptional regulator with XRE-family HTH domain
VTLKTERPVSHAYPKFLITLGDHLRKRRLDLSLRQKDVSQRLGVSEASIWYWEKNLTSPSLRYIPKIIEFLGYTLYEKTPKTLGESIINARRLSGITQKELAIRLGIDPGTLSNWEKGKDRPSEESLQTLSDLFTSLHLDTLKPRV